MATIKNQIGTLTPTTVQKYQTVNKIADQLDSSSLLLSAELITVLPGVPVTNKAYLVNFGTEIGKILYYYLDSATNTLKLVYVPASIGDTVLGYKRGTTNWFADVTIATGTINSSILVEGFNYFRANTPWSFSYTGNVYTNITVVNPLPIPQGLTTIYKSVNDYYVSR